VVASSISSHGTPSAILACQIILAVTEDQDQLGPLIRRDASWVRTVAQQSDTVR
jgi:hypothetical protein